MNNVYSYSDAVQKGLKPKTYTYDKKLIPLGKFEAKLDFKIWGKKVLCVNCYFNKVDTDQSFIISVYKNRAKDEEYFVGECSINFKTCADDQLYEITIEKTNRGSIKLIDARQIN